MALKSCKLQIEGAGCQESLHSSQVPLWKWKEVVVLFYQASEATLHSTSWVAIPPISPKSSYYAIQCLVFQLGFKTKSGQHACCICYVWSGGHSRYMTDLLPQDMGYSSCVCALFWWDGLHFSMPLLYYFRVYQPLEEWYWAAWIVQLILMPNQLICGAKSCNLKYFPSFIMEVPRAGSDLDSNVMSSTIPA